MQLGTLSQSNPVVGLDIGGANLKYADTHGHAGSVEFPLWARPQDLSARLTSSLDRYGDACQVAATMTGELADCFLDRAAGVTHIVDHLRQATDRLGLPEPWIYSMDGTFYRPSDALSRVDAVAASNWHALARFLALRLLRDRGTSGLVVDIGSTTTDLIPVRGDGQIVSRGHTDYQRLREGSLVYLGGGRTPVCSVVDRLEFRGESMPVMREVFATMADVRVLLGHVAEDPTNCDTADGKPKDRFHACNRLARMIGLDHREVDHSAARHIARQVHDRARQLIAEAFAMLKDAGMVGESDPILLSGHADDLAGELSSRSDTLRVADQFGPAIARCAPSYAVAHLFADSMAAG